MKIWVDKYYSAPDGYMWVKNEIEVLKLIGFIAERYEYESDFNEAICLDINKNESSLLLEFIEKESYHFSLKLH